MTISLFSWTHTNTTIKMQERKVFSLQNSTSLPKYQTICYPGDWREAPQDSQGLSGTWVTTKQSRKALHCQSQTVSAHPRVRMIHVKRSSSLGWPQPVPASPRTGSAAAALSQQRVTAVTNGWRNPTAGRNHQLTRGMASVNLSILFSLWQENAWMPDFM